jgi:AraC-like DNA-binding protein
LARDKVILIGAHLERLMQEKQPFLQIGYGLRNLAEDLHIPAYQASCFLNREIGLNFNDFLNRYRVWYCERLIQKGLVEGLNLQRIALQCGFYNRNSLSAAFKKFTGFTPARYLRGWVKLLSSEIID